MSSDLKAGDLVWARMKGFSPWPALIVKPGNNAPKAPRKDCQWVFFFGSENYAWIEDSQIKPYGDFKEKFVNTCKTVPFKKAVGKIEEFIQKRQKNPAYSLHLPPEQGKEKPAEDTEETFNKLVSQKKTPKRSSSVKRQNSDASTPGPSTSRGSLPKRSRLTTTPPRTEENGIGDAITDMLNSSVSEPDDNSVGDLNNLTLKTQDIPASNLTFGFIGIGVIGEGIVRNLVNSGHKVNLYNRTLKKCVEMKEQADAIKPGLVHTYITPCDVMQNSDIIFSCVTDPRAAKENVIGNCGVAGREGDSLEGKGYVEMTSIDAQTSKDICEIIKSRGGRYLEAQIQGSKKEADEGSLFVLTAGDKSLFIDCQSCFKAMGKTAFFLGEVGYACKTNLIIQLMKGVALVGLAEGFALADRCGISLSDVMNIFNMTSLKCDYLVGKAELILQKDFKHVQQAVEYMQKDMKLALDLSDQLRQPLLMTSVANEVYKNSRRLGYDGQDASCIYFRTRH